MARLSPEERRDAIVGAALTVAREKGLGATTVRDVAAAMGTSSGLVHHYFDSMDEVLAQAFARAAAVDLEAVRTGVDEAPTATDAIIRFLASYAPEETDWTFQLWLDAWSEANRRPPLQVTSARLNVEWQQVVADIVRRGVESGEFVAEDPEASAWRIISLLDGLVLQVVAHRTTLGRERMMDWAMRGTETELGLALHSLSQPIA